MTGGIHPPPIGIGGYVLAGGRSSRMGRDKALVSLAGKPLIEHAVTKLRHICADVRILSSDSDLAAFAPLVSDIHPGCGPIGGIEAALLHTTHDWNLFVPVDLPFLPAALLWSWISGFISRPNPQRPGIHIFDAAGRRQPGVCLIHKAVVPLITRAIDCEEFALLSVFEEVGRVSGWDFTSALPQYREREPLFGDAWQRLSPAQLARQDLWFLNVNTKEELSLAESHPNLLDT